MRVTGGELCGRAIRTPRGRGVRPTQDRVREALFAMLGERLQNARFLDLFAGSGAAGIEAWSRGARDVWWVESDRRVAAVLRENVSRLCSGEGRIVESDAGRFIAGHRNGAPFDIVFADPPYCRGADRNWAARLPGLVDRSNVLAEDGLLVVEQGAAESPVGGGQWRRLVDRTYGNTRLCVLDRTVPDGPDPCAGRAKGPEGEEIR